MNRFEEMDGRVTVLHSEEEKSRKLTELSARRAEEAMANTTDDVRKSTEVLEKIDDNQWITTLEFPLCIRSYWMPHDADPEVVRVMKMSVLYQCSGADGADADGSATLKNSRLSTSREGR